MPARIRHLIRSLFGSIRLQIQHVMMLEAGLIGLFWIQALRFLIGSLYSRIGSASITAVLDPSAIDTQIAGVVQPGTVSGEISFLLYMIALPLLLLVLGRMRWMLVGAAILTALGRALMLNGGDSMNATMAAMLTLGGGLVYIGMVIRHRVKILPYLFIFSLGADQLFRAVGNTLDPSWSASYANPQVILSVVAVILSIYTVFRQQQSARRSDVDDQGLLTFWGGIGLGALLFLELSLLALPNGIAGRADADYTTFVPFVLAATLLPLVPWVRKQARTFIALFDSNVRGWSWMLLAALLIVIGTRVQTIEIGNISQIPLGGAALVAAQLIISLMWWWLVRPQAKKERNLTGLWLVGTTVVFAILLVFDNFTYDYAFVRDLGPELSFLNSVVPPILRGFKGMGLGVILFAVFLAAIPMVQTQRRIPWTGGEWWQSALMLVVIAGVCVGGAIAARPPVITGVRNVDRIRIGTYNIHNGYSEFYNYDLEDIARTIQQSGVNVVMIQQSEAGRMTSFGVDQPLWLARRLGMDVRFFPTNEGLQGLAVLSNIEIVYDEGFLLDSETYQTGLQRVQVQPDTGAITFYNTWLAYAVAAVGNEPINTQEQENQINEIRVLIGSQNPGGSGRIVLGGTFNNVPDSPLIEQLRGMGFEDPFAGQPIELSATLRRIGVRARIDYLWTRTLPALGAVVMDSAASDHRMVIAEVLITGRANQ